LKRKLRKLFETTSVKYLRHVERPQSRKPKSTPIQKKKSFVMESPLTTTKVVRVAETPMVDVKILIYVLVGFVAVAIGFVMFSGGKSL
jgi:hypothetical protein